MLELGHTVLVAVSGGADSMALLHSLWRLREPLALQLYVAHLNHQMRPNAAEDANFVETVARNLGLRCICDTQDVPTYRRQHKLSPEDAARRVRYAFLRATATQLRADRIAVGHTADDQAETVLLHLLRGSGLRGLCGIPPVRGAIIRPLIHVSRSDMLDYLQTHQLLFREDPIKHTAPVYAVIVSDSTSFQPCGNTLTRVCRKPSAGPHNFWRKMRPPCKPWRTSTFSQPARQPPRGPSRCRRRYS